MLLSKSAMVSYAAPHLPLKWHFIPLELCSMSSMTAISKLRKLIMITTVILSVNGQKDGFPYSGFVSF